LQEFFLVSEAYIPDMTISKLTFLVWYYGSTFKL